ADVAAERTERAIPDDGRTHRCLERIVDAVRIRNEVATDATDIPGIRPEGSAEAVVFRQDRDRELEFSRTADIPGRTQRLAASETRTDTAGLEAAHEGRAKLVGFQRMHAVAAEVVDHAGRTADAGPDTGVLQNRQVVAGTGLRL